MHENDLSLDTSNFHNALWVDTENKSFDVIIIEAI